MKLTSKFQKVKLGCGMTISVNINGFGVMKVRIPNFEQTIQRKSVYSDAADILIYPDSIAGLERILKAFKAAANGHEEA